MRVICSLSRVARTSCLVYRRRSAGETPAPRAKRSLVVAVILLMFSLTERLSACSVCFGDPNSPMTHGAKVAVFFLLGVVGMVLGAIVGVAIFWVHRARLVDVQQIVHASDNDKK